MMRALAVTLLVVPLFATGTLARAQSAANIGVVIMHGKGGSPTGLVDSLAEGLERRGYRVANLEMPWSGKREYDASVAAAEQEVSAAIDRLRGEGAARVFVAGHSQGGVFALHYAARHPLDGLIIIAPGGNVGTRFYQDKVGASVDRARGLVASGKGDERGEFADFEGAKGISTVHSTAAIYLTWFDPDGAMNQMNSTRALPASLPVLHVAPTGDYPALTRAKQTMFKALPANPLTRLYEPNADHRGAPAASLEEVARWTAEVAARK
jgi:pimeloyl-ACP methyl ester carboxylesterase